MAAAVPCNTGIRSRSVAILVADGAVGVKTLDACAQVMDFITNQFRHGKTRLAIGASKSLPERAGAATSLEKRDPEREASALAP